jgi:hypothetical protein
LKKTIKTVNIHEAIKRGLGRDDFQVDPRLLRRGLLDNGYSELQSAAITPSRLMGCSSS